MVQIEVGGAEVAAARLEEAELEPRLRVLRLQPHGVARTCRARRRIDASDSCTRASAKSGSSASGSSDRARSAASAAAARFAALERGTHLAHAPLREPRGSRRTRRRRGTAREPRPRRRDCARARARARSGEHADREERGPRHGDEVPRKVDERMKEPERGEDRQRGRRRPLGSLETPKRGDGRPSRRGDEGEKEQQADGACAREELERNAVRLDGLDRLVAIPLAGDLERVGAGPAERLRPHDLERLAPPLEPVVRARVDESGRALTRALARTDRDRAHTGDHRCREHDQGGLRPARAAEGAGSRAARPTRPRPRRPPRPPR